MYCTEPIDKALDLVGRYPLPSQDKYPGTVLADRHHGWQDPARTGPELGGRGSLRAEQISKPHCGPIANISRPVFHQIHLQVVISSGVNIS
jgi:hypothetical protein